MAGEGLAVDYTFSRQPFSGDPHMVSLHIHFSNSSDTPIKGLHVGTPKLPAGLSIQEFPEIGAAPGQSVSPQLLMPSPFWIRGQAVGAQRGRLA